MDGQLNPQDEETFAALTCIPGFKFNPWQVTTGMKWRSGATCSSVACMPPDEMALLVPMMQQLKRIFVRLVETHRGSEDHDRFAAEHWVDFPGLPQHPAALKAYLFNLRHMACYYDKSRTLYKQSPPGTRVDLHLQNLKGCLNEWLDLVRAIDARRDLRGLD